MEYKERGNGDWMQGRGHSVFTRIQEYCFSPSVIHQLGEGEDKEHWWNKGWVHNSVGSLVLRQYREVQTGIKVAGIFVSFDQFYFPFQGKHLG